MNSQDWESKTCFLYFIACSLLCNNSVIFFFCDGDAFLG